MNDRSSSWLKSAVHHVESVRSLTADAFVLRVERHGLAFRAGQHVTLGVHGAMTNREYSVYSSEQEDFLEFLVKVQYPGGTAASLRQCRPGARVDLAGPYGEFTVASPSDTGRRYLFVATGVGIAPFRSIVRTFPSIDYHLLHGVRLPEELYDASGYESGRYTSCVTAGAGGFPGRVTDYLAAHPTATDTLCYICGTGRMISDVYDLLREQGVSSNNLLTEAFY